MNLGIIRLSDLKGDEQTGPVRQREIITRKFTDLGVAPEDITWAEDLDVSAFHVSPLKRPMLRRAFNRLTPGAIVVFYRLDRFVRRVFPDFSDMVSFSADKKVSLHSATETLDLSGPVGMMTATMLAFIAQMESENISARVKNTQDYLRRNGRWSGGPVAYGYRPTRIEGKPGWYLEIDPETTPTLREAIQRVLDGHSSNSVALWLTRQGVLPPAERGRALRGKPLMCECGHPAHTEPCDKTHKCHHRKREGRVNKKLHEYDECSEPCPAYKPRVWKRESFQQIMRSPALCGYVVENKVDIVRDDTGMPVTFAEGITDFETWQEIQAHLDGRAVKKVRTISDSLLLNVAYCDCGAPLYLGTSRHVGKTREYVKNYYRATRRAGRCPGALSIRAEVLDDLVQRELLKTLGGQRVLRKEESTDHRRAIEADRRNVAAQIMELTQEMFVKGRPRANHDVLMAQLQAQHAELTAALDAEDMPETRLVETDELFSDKWERMTTLERRIWLMDAGVRIVAVKGKLPPLEFLSLPKTKRSMIVASEDGVNAVIYLGDLGEMLRRARA
jgi:site-specific DNA recombinase